jgi:hypothetical protein
MQTCGAIARGTLGGGDDAPARAGPSKDPGERDPRACPRDCPSIRKARQREGFPPRPRAPCPLSGGRDTHNDTWSCCNEGNAMERTPHLYLAPFPKGNKPLSGSTTSPDPFVNLVFVSCPVFLRTQHQHVQSSCPRPTADKQGWRA